ncbi:hypothetical protein Droror1_Dr00025225 [Drosera rotundifolia]
MVMVFCGRNYKLFERLGLSESMVQKVCAVRWRSSCWCRGILVELGTKAASCVFWLVLDFQMEVYLLLTHETGALPPAFQVDFRRVVQLAPRLLEDGCCTTHSSRTWVTETCNWYSGTLPVYHSSNSGCSWNF